MLKVGDEVYLEECWEDEAGHSHDEYATVTRIYDDGRCRFRLEGNQSVKRVQAWINKMDFYAKDYEPI